MADQLASEIKISAIVHTRNSAATLDRALGSLQWTDELLVVDMESTDESVAIARKYAARIISVPIAPRVDGIRTRYLDECRHEWILQLDSDEYLAADAGPRLRACIQSSGHKYDAFSLPRYNYIAGQVMRGGNWYPDPQPRLVRKGTVVWGDTIHQTPIVKAGPHRHKGLDPKHGPHIHHDAYADLREFLSRQLTYALSDRYDAGHFDFGEYIAAAYEQLSIRQDKERDGDLSQALAVVMAWDQIVRGLIHWDSLDPKPPLGVFATLPVATQRIPWWQVRLHRIIGRHYSWTYLAHWPREALRWWMWKRREANKP